MDTPYLLEQVCCPCAAVSDEYGNTVVEHHIPLD